MKRIAGQSIPLPTQISFAGQVRQKPQARKLKRLKTGETKEEGVRRQDISEGNESVVIPVINKVDNCDMNHGGGTRFGYIKECAGSTTGITNQLTSCPRSA